MAKDPAVLFYTSDFLIGVSDMPFLERGYYITLLCLQHQKGHLSEKTICFTLGLRSVIEIPLVMEKFKQDEQGNYYQWRMEDETIKRAVYTESRRKNGSLGGRPKGKHKHNHMDNHMEDENEDINRDVNIDIDSRDLSIKKIKSKKFIPPALDEVKAYCTQRENTVDPIKFFDYFDAGNWIDSKGEPVKNWKQKIITWEQNGRKGKQNGNAGVDSDQSTWNGYNLGSK